MKKKLLNYAFLFVLGVFVGYVFTWIKFGPDESLSLLPLTCSVVAVLIGVIAGFEALFKTN